MATIAEGKRVEMNTHPWATIASYLTSFGLVIGSAFDFMNHNALAFGVIFGAITCWINYSAKSTMMNQFRDNGMRRRKTDFVDD
jgi:hypothetical protein